MQDSEKKILLNMDVNVASLYFSPSCCYIFSIEYLSVLKLFPHTQQSFHFLKDIFSCLFKVSTLGNLGPDQFNFLTAE